MKKYIPISLKRFTARKLAQVENGQLGRGEAEKLLKKRLRHSSKMRVDIIGQLTADYDEGDARAAKYFGLI